MAEPLTVDFLRDLYRHAGLTPSDEELTSLLPVVQAFYDGAPQVEEILQQEDEALSTFRLPISS